MSGRNNNTAQPNAAACNNNSENLDPTAYEAQYRRIVERAIASLVPDNGSDAGVTTQDSSSNDDASVSKQADAGKPAAKNGQDGRAAAAANVPKNIMPQPERPSASSLHSLQGLLQKAEQQQQKQQKQSEQSQSQNQNKQAQNESNSGVSNQSLSGSDRPVQKQGPATASNNGHSQQRTDLQPPNRPDQSINDQLSVLQALTQGPSSSNVTPDLFAGLQLLLQLLPLLQNQNQPQQRPAATASTPAPKEPHTQNFQNRQQLIPQQLNNHNDPQNALAIQLISQLLQSSNKTTQGNGALNAPNISFQNQQSNSSDLQGLLLQNLLAKALGTPTNAAQTQQDHSVTQASNRLQSKESTGDATMSEADGHSEAALKNLVQMASLVMAPSAGTSQGQGRNDPQPVRYASAPAIARQPDVSTASSTKQGRRAQMSRPNASSASLEAAATSQSAGSQQGSNGIPVFMDYDEEALTEYQCLLRKQIELFEATQEDVQASAQGRNNPILLGQVGIRCRYCASLPIKSRPRGAVYYSRTIGGIYQVGQNMAKLHFCRTCKTIPEDVRAKLKYLQAVNRRASGGKEYWSEGLRVLGVYEDGDVMRLRSSNS